MAVKVAGFEVDVECETEEMSLKYSGVTVRIMRITTEVAREMLSQNTRNRKLCKRHVEHFAHILSDGDMVMNGEAIIFAADGTLLNGQHRLYAVLKTGQSFDAMVVRGVDIEAFKTLDGGRKRKTFEVLAMGGEGNPAAVASAIQAVVAFVDSGGLRLNSGGATGRISTPAIAERFLDVYPQIRGSVCAMQGIPYMRNQIGYCLHFLFSLVNKRLARDFSEVLSSGSDDRSRPFNVLREHFIKNPMTIETRRSHSAKAIKAFNAEVSGARPKAITFSANEDFPRIAGLDFEALKDTIG